jgi:hypothetical protein
MLFVISSEVILQPPRPGYGRGTTGALFTGFGAMFFFAAGLGCSGTRCTFRLLVHLQTD